jgi:hypothetical protein
LLTPCLCIGWNFKLPDFRLARSSAIHKSPLSAPILPQVKYLGTIIESKRPIRPPLYRMQIASPELDNRCLSAVVCSSMRDLPRYRWQGRRTCGTSAEIDAR